MGEEKKKPRKRRVNFKRQALKTARKKNPKTRLLTVCHDTVRNLWKALVFDVNTKMIVCEGELEEGQTAAHRSLNDRIKKETEALDKELHP